MLTSLQVKATDASRLKRWIYEYFRAAAEKRELLKSDGKPIPAPLRAACRLGEILVYGPVRDQLGLNNARWCLTGGAPLGPDTFRFFRSFGVNLKQIYGATEASALIATQADDAADPNTVGRTLPGIAVRIGERGEVQVKGPGVFLGYFKQEEATRDTMTADGWLKTGDAGLIDPNGALAIIDRAKDVGKLADGTPFAPQFIENKLKFSPYVREAVAFGDQRPFVAAMIAVDMSTVGKWAEAQSLPYTSFMDLAGKPEVARLIVDEVGKINKTLPESSRVSRFVLLNKELEADDAEMTRTRKVRRGFVAEKYAARGGRALSGCERGQADNGNHLRGRSQDLAHFDACRARCAQRGQSADSRVRRTLQSPNAQTRPLDYEAGAPMRRRTSAAASPPPPRVVLPAMLVPFGSWPNRDCLRPAKGRAKHVG